VREKGCDAASLRRTCVRLHLTWSSRGTSPLVFIHSANQRLFAIKESFRALRQTNARAHRAGAFQRPITPLRPYSRAEVLPAKTDNTVQGPAHNEAAVAAAVMERAAPQRFGDVSYTVDVAFEDGSLEGLANRA
jgi:hypothetical protein